VKEREFQGWILDVAKRFGWRVWHVPTPMRPIGQNKFAPDPRGRGLPDLIMLHDDPPRLILAEVKLETGVLSEDQREFLKLARGVARSATAISVVDPPDPGLGLDLARHSPVGVYVWRPGNEALIEATLKSKVLA
jgi:hypothetical protein